MYLVATFVRPNQSQAIEGIGVDLLHSLELRTRYRTGLFISMSGFSPEFDVARQRGLHSDRVIVPVDRWDLEILVRAADRAGVLEDWIRRFSR